MTWDRRAVWWMDGHKAGDPELRRFRAEAEQWLGVSKEKEWPARSDEHGG